MRGSGEVPKWFSILLCVVLFSIPASAAQFGNFIYKVMPGNTVTITAYRGSAVEVTDTIPSTIAGNSVTSIGNGVFCDCTNLTSITIPDSVTSIGHLAFFACSGLTNITIPDSVTSIGDGVFERCSDLTNITIPDSVTNIGVGVFIYCTSLTSITIPDSVTSIGHYSFCYCTNLTNITIPDSVTSIGLSAFKFCSELTSITIPDSVTSIARAAFEFCSELRWVNCAGSAPTLSADVFSDTQPTVYYLPGTTGWGSTYGDRPAVLWDPVFTAVELKAGGISCTVTATTDIAVALEVSTNLAAKQWTRLCTTNLLGEMLEFVDSTATNQPTRFYRIVGP